MHSKRVGPLPAEDGAQLMSGIYREKTRKGQSQVARREIVIIGLKKNKYIFTMRVVEDWKMAQKGC